MIALCCYASENMTVSQERLIVSSLKYGVEKTFSYSPESYDPIFYSVNKKTLDAERGAGFWLWKPYIINAALHSGYLNEGDILIYSDAGVEIINEVRHIIEKMDQDIFFFSNGHPYFDWCKKKVMDAIYPEWVKDWEVRNEKPQVQASVIFMKVNDKVKEFMAEWLAWCQIPGFIDDSDGGHKGFQDNRHDQSILGLLQMKYGYKLHWWPTKYADHLPRTDQYPVMFDHHRRRNSEW
jgi:hypothetical protein